MIETIIRDIIVVKQDEKPYDYCEVLTTTPVKCFVVEYEDASYGILGLKNIVGKPHSRIFADLDPDLNCVLSDSGESQYKHLFNKNYILKNKLNSIYGVVPKIDKNQVNYNALKLLNDYYLRLNRILKHELLNICNTVIGTSDLIYLNYTNYNKINKDEVELLSYIGFRLKEFVDINLDMQSNSDIMHQIEYGDIADILNHVLLLVKHDAQEEGVEIVYKIDDEVKNNKLPSIILFQVLINLINNSLKYTDRGGLITIDVRLSKEGNKAIEIVFCDNGKGIKEKEIDNIFKFEFRGSNNLKNTSGYGIGLFVVKDLINRIGGNISVFSPIFNDEKNCGTKFIINLPIDNCQD